jgi:hypothetical protein
VPRSGGWLRSRRQVEIPRRVPGRGFNLLSWAGLVRGCIAEKRKQSASRVLARTAMPLVSPVGDALIFVRVNQVLVRLWACLLACLTGCAALMGRPPASGVGSEMLCARHRARPGGAERG